MIDFAGSDVHHQKHVNAFNNKVVFKNHQALVEAMNNNKLFAADIHR
jgi:protein-tyrosine phosphatase